MWVVLRAAFRRGSGSCAMPVDLMLENDSIVESLQTAVHRGEFGLGSVPILVKRVIQEHRWQERVVRAHGRETRFDRFIDFVVALPPDGLGADLPTIKRLCGDDPEAIDLIDQATQKHGGRPETGNIVTSIDRPEGNTSQKAVRRLRKDRPDLHAQVLAKGISPHAAMVEAGFRRKTATVPVDDPEKVSAFLAKHFEPDEIRKIADLAVHLREGGRP